jgi:hypothetical protein
MEDSGCLLDFEREASDPKSAYIEAFLLYAQALALRVNYELIDNVHHALLSKVARVTSWPVDSIVGYAAAAEQALLTSAPMTADRDEARRLLTTLELPDLRAVTKSLHLHANDAPEATLRLPLLTCGHHSGLVPLRGYTVLNCDVIQGVPSCRKRKPNNVTVLMS